MLLLSTNKIMKSLFNSTEEAYGILERTDNVANSASKNSLSARINDQKTRLEKAERLNAAIGLIAGLAAVAIALIIVSLHFGRGEHFLRDLMSDFVIMLALLILFKGIFGRTWAGKVAMYAGTILLCGSILYNAIAGSLRFAYLAEWIILLGISCPLLDSVKEHHYRYRAAIKEAEYAITRLDN